MKTIIIDWNCLKSIKSGERKKNKLENTGYEVVNTVNSTINNTSTLIFKKI